MKKKSIERYFYKTKSESINNALEMHIGIRRPLDRLSTSVNGASKVFDEHVRQKLVADYTEPVFYKVTVEKIEL